MYSSLFFTSFISATLWPLASEALFGFYVQQNPSLIFWLCFVATVGNSLGSILMFELANRSMVWIERSQLEKQTKLVRWKTLLKRHGAPILILAWLPLVGDVLPIAAGLLNLNRSACIFWIFIGKAGRYLISGGIILLV